MKTGNGTKAALKAYDIQAVDKDKSASVVASSNLGKVSIQKAIKSIADSIPDKLLVEKHLELLNAKKIKTTLIKGELIDTEESIDSYAIGKGLDMAYKIKGSYAPEKILQRTNVSFGNLDSLSNEELAKLIGE